MQDMVVGAPWKRVGIDLTGRHPRSRRGNFYILTYVDHFTKFAEAYFVPTIEAETTCRVLVEEIIPRFGVPSQLLTDQGQVFDNIDNRLMKGLCEVYTIDKIRTSAYKTSTNGATEHLHRTLNCVLEKVVSELQKDWDIKVPAVMAAYRATIHEATGYSPNFLMFGRELRAPIDLVWGGPGMLNMPIRTNLWRQFAF